MSNKSEATWHPNSGPEMVGYPPPHIPHADLIARLREPRYGREPGSHDARLLVEAADALAALGGTVSRNDADEAMTEAWYRAARERDEARAERDTLAHVIEQAPHQVGCTLSWVGGAGGARATPCTCWKSTPPAASLALHDAEVAAGERQDWADYLEHWGEAVGSPKFSQERVITALRGPRPFGRAAAIPEEAK